MTGTDIREDGGRKGRLKDVMGKSRESTKKVIDNSKEKTKTVITHGKEDLRSAKNIIREDFGYRTFRSAEDKRAYFIRAAKLFGPPAFLLAWYAFLLWTRTYTGTPEQLVGFSLLYLIPSPFGKETMIPAALATGAGRIYVALTFTFVDAFLVSFVAWNFDYIMRVPNVGRHARNVETAARAFLDKPSFANRLVKQLATIGIFLFVMLPFQGGGGANGAILGRVMGLRPARVIVAAILGTAIESFALTYASDWFLGLVPSWAGYVGYIILGGAVLLYIIAARRKKNKGKRAAAEREEEKE